MAYRKIPMSRKKLIEAYYDGGVRRPLRYVAEKLGVSHNTVRNWLITFEIYDSECEGRKKLKPID